jgi:hypothetical protein
VSPATVEDAFDSSFFFLVTDVGVERGAALQRGLVELHARERLQVLGIGRLAHRLHGRRGRGLGRAREDDRHSDDRHGQDGGHGPQPLSAKVVPEVE